MCSKLVSVATVLSACVTALLACGSYEPLDSEHYQVGRKPEFYSSSYLWRAGDQNSLVAVSKEGLTLQRFTLEPFAHVSSLPLPLPYEKQGVAASYDGAYFIALAETEYAIMKANGEATKNPIPLIGKIVSIAFDPVHHLAVISDEFQTMAVLVLGPGGDIMGMWKAGSKFPNDKLVGSGTMMADGRLVFSLGATTIAVVDVPASVAAQAWQATYFEVAGATDMKWMSTMPDQPDMVMLIDGSRVVSLNIATQTVVAEKNLSNAAVLGYFRDFIPHVLTQGASAVHDVTYMTAGGQLATSQVRGTDYQISQTMLDTTGTLTVVYDPKEPWSSAYYDGDFYQKHEVYRFRLSDNAGLDKTVIDENVSMALTPNHVFLLYPSALGKAVRRDFGPVPSDQMVQGYNLDLIRQRYQDQN